MKQPSSSMPMAVSLSMTGAQLSIGADEGFVFDIILVGMGEDFFHVFLGQLDLSGHGSRLSFCRYRGRR